LLGGAVLTWAWMTAGMLALGLGGWLYPTSQALWTAAGLAIAGLIRVVSRPPPEGPWPAPEPWGAAAILALGMTLALTVLIGIPSLMMPVKVVSDGPIYHLYFAVKWWKAGRLFLVPPPFGGSAAPHFPARADLCVPWLLLT